MKKIRLFVSLFVLLALITACAPAEEPILTVGNEEYTRSELESLGTLSVDYTNKDGETTGYEGVLLSKLLEDAEVSGENITFSAADGYEAEISTDEALACENCIVAFDDGSLRMVMPDFSGKLQVKDVVSITEQ
ncbi:MAG: hypothetical protein ACOCYU_06840 [Brevefilum sp.]